MRGFEATIAGTCYSTRGTGESAKLFEPSVEIETYADSKELAAKVWMRLAEEDQASSDSVAVPIPKKIDQRADPE
jgi:hypothetical protein